MKKTSFLKILKYFLSIFIAFTVVYFLFNNQDPIKLIKEIQKTDVKWVGISMIFGGLAVVIRGVRWIALINALGYQSSKSNAIASVAVMYFTNLFIPRAGEISRCTSLNQVEKIPIEKLFGTILIERVIDLLFLLGLMFLTIFLKFNDIINFYSTIKSQQIQNTDNKNLILTLIIISILVTSFFLLRKRLKKSSVYSRIVLFIAGLKEGFKSIQKMKEKSTFWLHTFSIWVMYFLMTYVCFFSLEETAHLTASDGLFLLVLGGIGMIIPTPGGIGSYHAIVMIGLSVLGVGSVLFGVNGNESNPALLFPTIIHAGQTLMGILMGLIGLLILFLSKKKNNVAS